MSENSKLNKGFVIFLVIIVFGLIIYALFADSAPTFIH